MPRSRIITLIGIVFLIIGIVIASSSSTRDEVATEEGIDQPEATVESTLSPTATSVSPTPTVMATATVTATPTPKLDGQLVWQDSFDDTASGWEPMYTAPSTGRDAFVNKNAFNGYVNDAYRFVVNNVIDDRLWLLWDFNTAKALPSYPYAVEVDVSTTRDHTGAVILDYRGDINNIDNGDGVFVRFHIGESPSTPNQAWSLLGVNQGMKKPFFAVNEPFSANVYALEVFESSAGQRYNLACDQLTLPLLTRTALLRIEVDATLVHATLTDTANAANTTSVTCKRIPTGGSSATAPAIMGLVGVYSPRVVPVVSDYALDFAAVRVLTIDAVNASAATVSATPVYLKDSDCNTEFNMGMRKRLVRYTDDSAFCAALGDWGLWDIEIIRYAQRPEELMGRWQCGSDPEGMIELVKEDWRTTVKFSDNTQTYAYAVASSPVGGDQSHLILWDERVQPGDRITQLPYYFLAYNDTDLVASWAGKCTRVP